MLPVLPDTPSSVLQLMNADKKALEMFANSIIRDVKEGRENPLEIQLLIKKYEFVLNEIKENIKVNVNTEVAKYGEKEFEYGGAKCHYTPVKTEYDFSVCNDPNLDAIDSEIERLKELKKVRENYLKSLPQTITVVNDDTGEMETISPPLKKQTHGLKVTLK
jgi:uncharacterized protein YlbG (UPF0298 family)